MYKTPLIALNEGLSLFTTNLVMFALSRAMAEMAQTFFEMYNVPFVLQEEIAENNAQLNLEVTA